MPDLPGDAQHLQLVIHNDDETPADFVAELLCSVFGKPGAEAMELTAKAHEDGQIVCGTYPAAVARKRLEIAQEHIRQFGQPLLITAQPMAADSSTATGRCDFCGVPAETNQFALAGRTAIICERCILAGAKKLADVASTKQFKYAH